MALFSVNAILAADNTENIGTWYEHDTLYVFSIKVPDHATLTSMKLQLKNSRGSFRTVGSPRIQIIPQEVLGKEIVFTRSRHIINADIGSPKQPLEFRLAFYETGLDLYQYGLVTQTAKPAQHYDLELVAESSYPLEKDALVDTAQIVTSTQADLRPTTVSKPQNSETITQPQTVNQDTTSSLRQVPASIEETTSVDPTKTDTCECNDDSTRAIQSKVTKKASTDSTLAATAGTENPKKQVAKPKNPPDGKSKTTSPSNQPKVKRPPVPSKAPRGTIFDQGILNGIVLEASMASPYWVSKNLTTWYSSIDWRISFTTPFYYKLGPMMVGFTIELSGFDFENTFPEGGRFNGQAMLGYLTGYWRGLNMELGGGSFAGTSGMITGLSGKILEGSHLYLSGGVRGVLIQDINPIGLAQWAEGRLTLGYKF